MKTPFLPGMRLVDDGTLDTVLSCTTCGDELRLNEAERDKSGFPTEAWMERCSEGHAQECHNEVAEEPQ